MAISASSFVATVWAAVSQETLGFGTRTPSVTVRLPPAFTMPANPPAFSNTVSAPTAATRTTTAVATKILSPISARLAALRLEKTSLEELLKYMADPDCKEGVILGAFIALSDLSKHLILYSLWKDHGYVDQYDYARLAIEYDPTILRNKAAPLIHSEGGTLVQQRASVIGLEIEEEENRVAVATLLELQQACASSKTNTDLLKIFDTLPPAMQGTLYGKVYHESPDKDPSVGNWGEVKLRSDVRCLTTCYDPSGSILQKVVASLQATIENKKQTEQKALFLATYHSDKLGHFELKRLYQALPASIQAHDDIPKPPFYGRGVRSDLYKLYGAHNSGEVTTFKVYAPNAQEIKLVIRTGHRFMPENFIPMDKVGAGMWEVTTRAPIGTKYQYLVKGADGQTRRKSDPYARESRQERFSCDGADSHTTQQLSVVTDKGFAWTDETMISTRSKDPDAPATIYEVHVSSWKKRDDGSTMNWRELAVHLASYCKDMNYTHVELIGAMDHPDENSWGYQPCGFFAPNHRMGSSQDFKFFVNYMHSQNLKVIVDWVPGHFATDNFSLKNFDGTKLYEHSHPDRNFQHSWNVYMFDYEKRAVRDFLISSASYWAEEFHVDGLRVDAVKEILHTDSGRRLDTEGNPIFLPHHKNKMGWGGHIHSDAKTFFRDLNRCLHTKHSGVFTHAEESSGFPGLTAPVSEKRNDEMTRFSTRGLEFDGKQNLARMSHTLNQYMRVPPLSRKLEDLIRGMEAEAAERVVDVLSHDESANGKGSLRGKMHGTLEQQFAQVRLMLSRAICSPGMKLTMMGNEIAQEEEWSGRLKRELEGKDPGISAFDWNAVKGERPYPPCQQVQQMVKELNALYLTHPALFSSNKGSDFTWIDKNDRENQVMSYHRTSKEGNLRLACVHNFGTRNFESYEIPLPDPSSDPLCQRITSIKEIFNSDDTRFGGSGMTNTESCVSVIYDDRGIARKIKLRLSPQATVILEETLS